MSNQFDDLAKGLAQSVTQRQALKRFGIGLAGGFAVTVLSETMLSSNSDGTLTLAITFTTRGVGHSRTEALLRSSEGLQKDHPLSSLSSDGGQGEAFARRRAEGIEAVWIELAAALGK
jgi:hypothetical protein